MDRNPGEDEQENNDIDGEEHRAPAPGQEIEVMDINVPNENDAAADAILEDLEEMAQQNIDGDVAVAIADAVFHPFHGFDEVSNDQSNNYDEMDMLQVLSQWDKKHTTPGYDPVPGLKRLAEIFEKETDIYMRKDPDPFDERHPYRSDPNCQFGSLLKQLFRKDLFMNKLVNDYLRDNYFTRQNVQKSALELNILACRLILVIMPGLETSAVFQLEFDNLLNRIYGWAEDSIEPLQSYATGLLASAMEVTDIAVTFKDLNTRLVPKMLKRLHMLQAIYKSSRDQAANSSADTSHHLDSSAETETSGGGLLSPWMNDVIAYSPQRFESHLSADPRSLPNGSVVENFPTSSNMSTSMQENSRDGCSSRFYRKMYIPIHPWTTETSQMLILRYLTTMGEYQEFLGLVFEHNAMQLIFNYIENLDRRDTCLAFEALKYLASLLCHKKFALEFIAHGGLELLLNVPRPSMAATGVSITLYYLAYSEDAMERICTMPRPIIIDLVRYAEYILGRSYDSGKCHATMFFGLSFQFKVILDVFDAEDGLRKLYNVISILKILNPSINDDDQDPLNEDVECAQRQLVRHVCVALKRYMESHLYYKYNAVMHQQWPSSREYAPNGTKAARPNLEQISDQVRTLQEHMPVRARWEPVDQLLKLGGINLLLKIIAYSYDWNTSGRSETLRSALDVLSICCVVPRVYLAFCDNIDMPDNISTSGIFSILGAASGDISGDTEVQKSALALLCHCVCSPIARKEPNTVMKCFGSSKKSKSSNRYSEDLVEKIWEAVCSNNGIIVLLSLMQIKQPITDADCIRGMACRALAGLARSERVRQIVGKLPLFASGQIQALMRDPILQEKRAEHVIFQKYALELLERVSGKSKPLGHQLDPSLANIHKANVVAQTKIQYNDTQLYQLIHDHLESKGLQETAQMLQREAGLTVAPTTTKSFHQSPFDYKVMTPANSLSRNRLRNRMPEISAAINNVSSPACGSGYSETAMVPIEDAMNCTTAAHHNNNNNNHNTNNANNGVTPIKLVKLTHGGSNATSATSTSATAQSSPGPNAHPTTPTIAQRSLQKQICSLPGDGRLAMDDSPPTTSAPCISLGTIVTEYLTNQHALCNHPMTTCPQFDLFTPHKCPDPKPNRVMGQNLNMTARLFTGQSGFNTKRLDRRYVHSNFAPWRTIRSNDFNEVQFTCCDLIRSSNILLVGTQQGDAKAFSITDSTELFNESCHSYMLDSIIANRAGDLVLTSCSWHSPLSVLWSIKDNAFASKLRFDDEFYCEFSNLTQEKVLGTRHESAAVYDIQTGQKVATYAPPIANQYTKNRATFNPTDELILSDGVLWDVRSGKHIHKFDKLNQSLSGIFHPNGLEIISNTEVWDLRTFHLLQTIPVLDQCLVKFSPLHVMYGICLDVENRNDFEETTSYDTSFKVLDAYDYSSIATIDVKRNIYDLSVNSNGSLIALVENQLAYESKQETYVKIYAVGMKKNDQQEEDQESEGLDSEDGSDDSSSEDVLDISDIQIRRRPNNPPGAGNDRNDSDENDSIFSVDDDQDDDDEDDDNWIDMASLSGDSSTSEIEEARNNGNGQPNVNDSDDQDFVEMRFRFP